MSGLPPRFRVSASASLTYARHLFPADGVSQGSIKRKQLSRRCGVDRNASHNQHFAMSGLSRNNCS
jgi:hypothetical protein